MSGLKTMVCVALVLSACGSRHKSDGVRGEHNENRGTPTTELRVSEGAENAVSVDVARCVESAAVTARIFVAADLSQNIAVRAHLQDAPDGCAHVVDLQLSGLKSGSYVLTIEGTASGEAFKHDVRVEAQPAETPSSDPAPSGGDAWPGEPAADVDCNGRSCEDVVGELVAILRQQGSAQLYKSLARGEGDAFATLRLDGDQFSIDAALTSGMQPALTKGDVAPRRGRLALRSGDHRVAAYFRFYPLNENGQAQRLLVGKVPRTGGGSVPAYIFVD